MRSFLSILAGVALAIALSQFPEYAQQYAQRLGGAVDELKILTEDFDRAATESGLTRDAALGRFESGDSFLAGRGVAMKRSFARYAELSATLAEIQGETGWERFKDFGKYFDGEIASRALQNYQPAVPVTAEGLAYAAVGFFLGFFTLSAVWRILAILFRRRPRRERETLAAS